MNEATRLANLALETRGYLVLWERKDEPVTVGSVLETICLGRVEGPVRVLSITNRADFEQQARLVGVSAWFDESRHTGRFLRVVAE